MSPMPSALKNNIAEISSETAERCKRAGAAIGSCAEARNDPDGLFAALFTGNTAFLDRANAPTRDWVSWVEGFAPYPSLLEHAHIVLDLVPCKTEDDFLRVYGCTSHQFLRLLERHGKRMSINIRDEPEDYAMTETAIADIISAHKQTPTRFYRLPVLREIAFAHLGIDFPELQKKAFYLLSEYRESVWPTLEHSSGQQNLRTVNRNGSWPHPRQAVVRRLIGNSCGRPRIDCGRTAVML